MGLWVVFRFLMKAKRHKAHKHELVGALKCALTGLYISSVFYPFVRYLGDMPTIMVVTIIEGMQVRYMD